jgi:hypothetical protein
LSLEQQDIQGQVHATHWHAVLTMAHQYVHRHPCRTRQQAWGIHETAS